MLVPGAGLEPARVLPQRLLRPPRLPDYAIRGGVICAYMDLGRFLFAYLRFLCRTIYVELQGILRICISSFESHTAFHASSLFLAL